ncbi:MAG: YraN family protein [Clostridia bacterium]|nr:YraN family protein [Clostridia bacterium]
MGKTKDGHVIVRDNKELGRIGENLVLCRYVDRGWKPVAVNWRAGAKAELDVIVFRESEDLLCFCEVKTRSIDRGRSGTDIAPADSVNARKRMKIKFAAKLFIEKNPAYAEKNVRFDVAEVYNIDGAYYVSIIENAF